MAKECLKDFKRLNDHFIKYEEFTEDELVKYFWEYLSFFFFKIYKNCKSKFAGQIIEQLNNDLKKFPGTNIRIINQREVLNQYGSLQGVIMNLEAQNSRQKPFNNEDKMAKIVKEFKIELGLQYE